VEKLYVTWRSLNFRKNNSEIFSEGVYLPLQVRGNDGLAVAYARQLRRQWVLIVIPLDIATATASNAGEIIDSYVELPPQAPRQWKNIFTGSVEEGSEIALAQLWRHFPVAFLEGAEQ
jgi:(1->4)-alpha-D-glucan 1-alpha-D-glucosylmutase